MGVVSPYSSEKHDIGILRTDGTTKAGLMLVRDKNNVPIYAEYDDEYLPDQKTETPGYDNLPVEKELALVSNDWRAGFGLETFDSTDPTRYYSSYNADLRFRGMGFLGPKATTVTKPTVTTLTIVNADMELNANWTTGAGTCAQNAAEHHGGANSWKCGPNAVVSWASQNIASGTDYKGRLYTFKCWVKTTFVGNGKIQINDGVTTSSSALHTGGGAWEQLTVTKTISAAATKLELILTNATNANFSYFDDATLIQPVAGQPVVFCEANSYLYMAMGNILTKLNAGGTAFDWLYNFPANITDLELFTDGYMYIALGYSNAYWYMSNAEAFTESSAATKTFKFFQTVHTTTDTMYGSDTANTVRSTTNPLNGGVAWGAQTTIDSGSYDITGLLSFDNALYIFKEDRPYYLNSAGAVKILTNITRPITSSTGGKNSLEWEERIYMPWGTEALLEYDNGNLSWLNPSMYCTNLSDFDAQVMGLAGDEEWLFAGLDNGTKIEIVAGRYETISVSRWVWHPISELTLSGIETLFISSVYQKRLWIASTATAEALNYLPLPQGYGDVANDANRSFQTGGYYITPWLHANFPADNKAWIKVSLTMANTTANIYWTVSYQKIGDSSWASIGDFKTSPVTTKYIPVDGAGTNPVSRKMRFKVVGTTNDTAVTPIIYSLDVRAVLYPNQRTLIYAQIKGADYTLDKEGQFLDSNAAYVKTVLDEAKSSTYPVTIYDLDGNTKTVKFLPLPGNMPARLPINTNKDRNIEYAYNVLMQLITVS